MPDDGLAATSSGVAGAAVAIELLEVPVDDDATVGVVTAGVVTLGVLTVDVVSTVSRAV